MSKQVQARMSGPTPRSGSRRRSPTTPRPSGRVNAKDGKSYRRILEEETKLLRSEIQYLQQRRHRSEVLIAIVVGVVFSILSLLPSFMPTFATWLGLSMSEEDMYAILIPIAIGGIAIIGLNVLLLLSGTIRDSKLLETRLKLLEEDTELFRDIEDSDPDLDKLIVKVDPQH